MSGAGRVPLAEHVAPRSSVRGERIGWKAGLAGAASMTALGTRGPLIGRLVRSGVLDPGVDVAVAAWLAPRLEPEIAVRLGRDLTPDDDAATALEAVDAVHPAIELVDVTGPVDDRGAVLRANVYQRGIVLGAAADPSVLRRVLPLRVDETDRARGDGGELARVDDAAAAIGGVGAVLAHLAAVVDASGERVRAGELVMTGTIVPPLAIRSGRVYTVDLGPLGPVSMRTRS